MAMRHVLGVPRATYTIGLRRKNNILRRNCASYCIHYVLSVGTPKSRMEVPCIDCEWNIDDFRMKCNYSKVQGDSRLCMNP